MSGLEGSGAVHKVLPREAFGGQAPSMELHRDWYFFAEQPASAPHMLRIVPPHGASYIQERERFEDALLDGPYLVNRKPHIEDGLENVTFTGRQLQTSSLKKFRGR